MITIIKNRNFYSLIQYIGITFVILIFLILQLSNPLSSYIEEDLGGHMIIEHSVFFLLGYCMLFSFEKLSKNNFCKNKISSKTYFIGSIFLKIKIFKEKSDLKINKYFYIIIIFQNFFLAYSNCV